MRSKELTSVLDQIHKVTGFDVQQYRASTLKRRLERRLHATKSKNYKEYLAFLKKDSSECYKFLDAFTINVTEFFRDKRVFLTLEREILPYMLEEISSKNRKRMRIWSIGCARGQEPYSLAIILNEISKNKSNNLNIIIHATDVNKVVLKQAKSGQYKKAEMKNVPYKYQNEYFIKINNDEFKIKDNIKKLVRFKPHDLIKGNTFGKFHLISCRNLFIFFLPQLWDELFKKIHASLKKGGILVLGTAEAPKDENLFKCLSSRDHIYQKIT